LEQVRESLRRAYESRLDNVKAARAEATAETEAQTAAEVEVDAGAAGEVEAEAAEQPDDGVTVTPATSPVMVTPSSVTPRDDLDVPRGLRVAGAWAWRILLLVLAGAAVLWVAAKLQVVVIPVLISILLSALLSPVVGVLRRAHVPRSLAAFLVLFGGIGVVGGVLYLVISQFVQGAPELGSGVAQGFDKLQQWTQRGPLHLTKQQLNDLGNQIQAWFSTHRETLTSGAISTVGTVGEILTGIFLVLFTTFFFLRDGRRISSFLIGVLPEPTRDKITSAADMSWATLVSYVRATALVAMIDAVGIGTAIAILRVPFALPLAALVFLAAFIPIVGATISGAVAVLVALVFNGPAVALILLAAVIGVQQLEGHVLQPLIMGRAVAIHPLAVIIAIATGALLAGIAGALVAVPSVAVLNTGIRHLIALHRAQETGVAAPPTPATGPPDAADGAPPAP
jgi:predicted PurR-regulated permease PerM